MLNRPASEFRSSTDTDFDVVVLGAGVIGINTAYWAMRAGRKVCIIDRQPAAGLETSFANGGQISVSHAEPWANPSAPLKILKWLFDDRSPLLFRPKLDIHQWLWIAQFLVDCLPQRADRHTTEIVRLATESRRLLREIREREDLHYDQRRQGILHFYRDQREFDAAIQVTELMREHGCNRNVIGRSEVLAIEPAFEARINEVVGATYTPEDESGDAHKYCQALAKVCAEKGRGLLLWINGSGSRCTEICATRGIRRDSHSVRISAFARTRHRDLPGQLFSSISAALWHPAEHLSGEGIFSDDSARRRQPSADHEPDGRSV